VLTTNNKRGYNKRVNKRLKGVYKPMQTLKDIVHGTGNKVTRMYRLNTIDGLFKYIEMGNGYTCACNVDTQEYYLFKGWSSTPVMTKQELINKLMEV
jgi:hypothetical protein